MVLRGKVQIVFSFNWAVLCALWREWGGGGACCNFHTWKGHLAQHE